MKKSKGYTPINRPQSPTTPKAVEGERRAPPRPGAQRRKSTNPLDILVLIDTNLNAQEYEDVIAQRQKDDNDTAKQLCLF